MFISCVAPCFTAEALMPDKSFGNISLSNFKSKKYVLLFFYPLDFTFVCPSEIILLSNKISQFKSRNTEVLGISIDSKFSHYAWANTNIKDGGIGNISFPLISDISKKISHDYDVLLNNSVAVRATVLIDKQGIVRHYSLNDLSLGRNIEEIIRLLDALQHTEKYGEVCPAEWNKGLPAMNPNIDSTKKYLQNMIKKK